jgi:hypothetical protein
VLVTFFDSSYNWIDDNNSYAFFRKKDKKNRTGYACITIEVIEKSDQKKEEAKARCRYRPGDNFFLEYAGELRIIALRRKKIGPLQNTATSLLEIINHRRSSNRLNYTGITRDSDFVLLICSVPIRATPRD